MFKKLFLFSLLIIATFSTTDERNDEGKKGSVEPSGKGEVESENKSKNGSGGNSTDDKELHQFAKLTKGINTMDKEFNIFLKNYRSYLVDSDPSLAKKYGLLVNKTAGKDYLSEPIKKINIEELTEQAKQIRIKMGQFLQNLKSKNGEEEGEVEKEGDKKKGTENTGDEGNGKEKGEEGDKKEKKGSGGGKGGDYSDYEIDEIDYEGTSDEEEQKLKELIKEG